ncbi:MAG: hypothetical protein MZW92_08090 [Comamonadaceae bacterium]|nr:hypothetical protein [Comamonadaceae bacterium]
MFIVAGDNFLVPLRHPEFFSVADLLDARPLPDGAEPATGFVLASSAPTRHAAVAAFRLQAFAGLRSGFRRADD